MMSTTNVSVNFTHIQTYLPGFQVTPKISIEAPSSLSLFENGQLTASVTAGTTFPYGEYIFLYNYFDIALLQINVL